MASSETIHDNKPSFLSLFEPAQLQKLEQLAERIYLPANQIVFNEGDAPDGMYIIQNGKVRACRKLADNIAITIIEIETGGIVGEMGLLSERYRSATVETLTYCVLLRLNRENLLELIRTSSERVIYEIFATISLRAQATTARYFQQESQQREFAVQAELEKHRSLSQMVAGVAHEINTPLGIINTAASIIRRELHTPALATLLAENKAVQDNYSDIVEALGLLESSVERAHKLVQNFKKVSVSQLSDTLENMNLADAVRDILNLFKFNAKKSNLRLEFQNKLAADITWRGYRGYLCQILLNLLTNIERYAYSNGAGGKVEIELGTTEGKPDSLFLLIVRDFGQGIAAANLPKVFDPFFTTGRATGGSGLGLAIVYNIVTQALRGNIAIESVPGKGTTVTISFPKDLTL